MPISGARLLTPLLFFPPQMRFFLAKDQAADGGKKN
jgi:hypothetical protein